jgi:putative SOS response-associated peptidase YedK
MCGRFTSASQLSLLAERFRADPADAEGHRPSWNVNPASDILVVVAGSDGARQLRELRWGLVPRWAKDTKGRPLINMRAETVREKPTWQRTLAGKRCIIPIDGFYEWQDQGKGQRKQPFYVTSRDGEPLALAGLWATWRDPEGDGEELWTCTILPEAWDAWLDPDNKDVEQLTALLKPAPEELLALWPVDQAVSNPRNNRPELLEPLEGHQPVTA